MAWVGIAVMLMFGAGLLVLVTLLLSLVLAGVHLLAVATRRAGAAVIAGLEPSTFEIPELRPARRQLADRP